MISANISRFSDVKISADGKYCALMYSPDGSDWQEIRIYNMITMALIKDHIKNVRYSTITWFQNGFFYNKFDSVNENKKYTDVETNQKIYYHKLGTDPLRDSIVFEDKANPFNTFGLVVTEDERFIIVHERFSDKNKNITYFKDSKKDEPFKILVSELNSHTTIIGSKGDTLFALSTNGGAYNGKLIEIDTKKPNAWAVISDNQEKYLIKQAVFVHDTFCLIMKESFNEYIAFISRDGEIMKTMKFPPGSDNEMICYSPDQNSILISKSYFVCPPVGDLLSMKDFTYKHRQS
jgi:prolyl oligopeptidase